MNYSCKRFFNDAYANYEAVVMILSDSVKKHLDIAHKHELYGEEDAILSYDLYIQYAFCAIATVEENVSETEREFVTNLIDGYDLLCSRIRGYRRFIRDLSKQTFQIHTNDYFSSVIKEPRWISFLKEVDQASFAEAAQQTVGIMKSFLESCKIEQKPGLDFAAKSRACKKFTASLLLCIAAPATGKLDMNKNEQNEMSALDQYLRELNNMIGLNSVKASINKTIKRIQYNKSFSDSPGFQRDNYSMHLVFDGNPGTGKTTVAEKVAKIYKELGVLSKGHFVSVQRSDLVAGFIGQTAVKTRTVIESALGGVLFIDEAYSLYRDEANDFGKEVIDELIVAMEKYRSDFIVIVAGYTNDMENFVNMNVGLKSRFKEFIHFEDYSADEMLLIFQKQCRDYFLTEEAKNEAYNFFATQVGNPEFGNARGVMMFSDQVFDQHIENVLNSKDDVRRKTYTHDDIKAAILARQKVGLLRKNSIGKIGFNVP